MNGHPGRAAVLLIGGGSGTGKTMLARKLSAQLGMPLSQADDFRLFGQRITSPVEHPDLHFFVDESVAAARSSAGPDELRDRLISVAQLVSHGLEIVIAHHVAVNEPLILEGDAVTPSLAAQATFNGIPAGQRVQAVFLHEPEESVVLANMVSRDRGIAQLAAAHQEKAAGLASSFGKWIAAQATEHDLPVVSSRPLETLFDRVLALIDDRPTPRQA